MPQSFQKSSGFAPAKNKRSDSIFGQKLRHRQRRILSLTADDASDVTSVFNDNGDVKESHDVIRRLSHRHLIYVRRPSVYGEFYTLVFFFA